MFGNEARFRDSMAVSVITLSEYHGSISFQTIIHDRDEMGMGFYWISTL